MSYILRFGPFELDVHAGELRKHGMRIRLGGQPLQILLLLLERPGEVVSRDELRQRLWAADSSTDFDAGLSTAVRKLRDALRDSADSPRFIETLPRRGYRFIAQVTSSETSPASRFDARWIVVAFALAVIIAITVMIEQRRAAAPIRSIAVLPFENLTGDPSQEFFADGVTNSLTANLRQIERMQIISAIQYKHVRKPLPVIGEELRVDAIVTGSVARAGDHVQISAQLIRAATDEHLWARSYQGEFRDAAALQTKIAAGIANAIGTANHRH